MIHLIFQLSKSHIRYAQLQEQQREQEQQRQQEQERQQVNQEPNLQLPERPNVETQVNLAMIYMVCFIAEHNLAYNIADHMPDLLRKMFPDSQIAAQLHMKRTKCSEVAKKMSSVLTEDLAVRLRANPFSLIIDETTDKSKIQCLTLVVIFLIALMNSLKQR